MVTNSPEVEESQDIDNDHPLEDQFFHDNVGDVVNLEVYRTSSGKMMTFKITLVAIPDHT